MIDKTKYAKGTITHEQWKLLSSCITTGSKGMGKFCYNIQEQGWISIKQEATVRDFLVKIENYHHARKIMSRHQFDYPEQADCWFGYGYDKQF